MPKILLVGGTHDGETIDFGLLMPTVWMYRKVDPYTVGWVRDEGDLPELINKDDMIERYYKVPRPEGRMPVYLEEELNQKYNKLLNEANSKRWEARRWAAEADDMRSTMMARIAMELNVEARMLEHRAERIVIGEER